MEFLPDPGKGPAFSAGQGPPSPGRRCSRSSREGETTDAELLCGDLRDTRGQEAPGLNCEDGSPWSGATSEGAGAAEGLALPSFVRGRNLNAFSVMASAKTTHPEGMVQNLK